MLLYIAFDIIPGEDCNELTVFLLPNTLMDFRTWILDFNHPSPEIEHRGFNKGP